MSSIFSFDDKRTWNKYDTVQQFRKNTEYVRAFHMCRPLDLSEYQTAGIIPPTRERMYKSTLTLLGQYVSEHDLKKAFDSHWNDYYAKGVYFGLDKNFLVRECGHYLIYGSEFVCGIAGEFWCQEKLKSFGKPTIIVAKIPIKLISDSIVQELIEKIACDFDDCKTVDFGFRITESLKPQYIEEFEFPTRIPDPLHNNLNYTYIGGKD